MSNSLTVIREKLDSFIDEKIDGMPQGFNKTRFVQNSMAVLLETKGIENCSPNSVVRTLIKGAFLGLDFFNKECYAIPYGGNVQFQTDYKGEIKLAKKYATNPIKDIFAKVVRVGDEFSEEIIAGQQTVNFKPLPFNNGEIMGAFAVVLYKDGSMMYDTMSKEDIENTRMTYSKQPKGKTWEKSTGEMYKKTVLRRLLKYIDIHFDTVQQKEAFEDASDMDFNQEVKPQQQSPLNDNATIIDAEFEEITEEQTDGTEQE
ncbi:recombinase RecT [Paenibacillus sp. Dod16]|uniref:recombinase RecT n=1 Tax=Paenibacillus sp. Dod16 TaxID=3416392 RepID=UPI003CFB4B81